MSSDEIDVSSGIMMNHGDIQVSVLVFPMVLIEVLKETLGPWRDKREHLSSTQFNIAHIYREGNLQTN